MLLPKFALAAALAVALSTTSFAATIVDYDLTGLTTTAPTSHAATTVASGVTAIDLTRGPGIGAAGLTNGFSANDFTLGSSLATAIANGDYYQFGFDVDSTHSVSLTTFDTALRRSALNGPNNFHLHVSFDDFATPGVEVASWQYFGRSSGTAPAEVIQYQWMTTDTPGQNAGNPIPPQVLSTTPSLLNIGPDSSVTFRMYIWGNNDGAADSNTVALGRFDGPTIEGTIVQIPEPTSFILAIALAVAGLFIRRR